MKSLFNKVAGLMVCNFIKKKNTGAQVFSCKSSLYEDLLCQACSDGCLSDMNQKIAFTKSINRETPVMASFFVQLQTCGLTIFQN